MPPKANHRRRRPPANGEAAKANQDDSQGNPSSSQSSSDVKSRKPTTTKKLEAVPDDEPPPQPEGTFLCLVCASNSINIAFGSCGHGVCPSCSHRLRFLYKRTKCVICITDCKHVVAMSVSDYIPGKTTVETVRSQREKDGLPLAHDPTTNMFFVDPSLLQRCQLIAGNTCPHHVSALFRDEEEADVDRPSAVAASENATTDNEQGSKQQEGQDAAPSVNKRRNRARAVPGAAACGAPSHRSPGALRAHVREQHRALFCDVCFSSRKEYVSRLPTYPLDQQGGKTSSKLKAHMKDAHPMCKFCGLYLLDDDALFEHLQKVHESCHICERAGHSNQYFRNFAALMAHYRAHHFVCESPDCQGVVYETSLELQAHNAQVHRSGFPRGSRSRRVQVDLGELHVPVRPGRRHGSSSAPAVGSEEDVRIEQERQAQRRRDFLASNVVFAASDSTLQGSAGPDDVTGRPGSSNTQPGSNTSDSDRPSHREQPGGGTGQASAANPTRGRPDDTGGAATSDAESSTPNENPDDGCFYQRPAPRDSADSVARNKVLVSAMRAALDPAEFEQFRSFSGDFRQGHMSADAYYDSTVELFGIRRAVRDILPELTALLPNPNLRQALEEVCVRRHPPPASSRDVASSTNPLPAPAAASSETSLADGFPSLPGAPRTTGSRSAPRMAVAPPTSNDFPRLGRVNRPAETSAQVSARQSSSRPQAYSTTARPVAQAPLPNMRRVFGTQGGPSPGPRATPQSTRLTAAAFPSLSSGSAPSATQTPLPASASSSGPGARLSANAFPSLGSAASTGPVAGNTQASQTAADTSVSFADPDVSNRAGAVWGGAAARGNQGGGRRRGPGRGPSIAQGPPPRTEPATGSTGDFPALGGSSGPQQGNAGPSSSSASASSLPGERKPRVVLDMAAMARERQKSALPKVGGSGSGFAWERKKMKAKRKEVKSSLAASSKGQAPREAGGDAPSLVTTEPTQLTVSGSGATRTEFAGAGGAESSAMTHEDRVGEDDPSGPNTEGPRDRTATLPDQFSYLGMAGSGDVTEDPAASFLGN